MYLRLRSLAKGAGNGEMAIAGVSSITAPKYFVRVPASKTTATSAGQFVASLGLERCMYNAAMPMVDYS